MYFGFHNLTFQRNRHGSGLLNCHSKHYVHSCTKVYRYTNQAPLLISHYIFHKTITLLCTQLITVMNFKSDVKVKPDVKVYPYCNKPWFRTCCSVFNQHVYQSFDRRWESRMRCCGVNIHSHRKKSAHGRCTKVMMSDEHSRDLPVDNYTHAQTVYTRPFLFSLKRA